MIRALATFVLLLVSIAAVANEADSVWVKVPLAAVDSVNTAMQAEIAQISLFFSFIGSQSFLISGVAANCCRKRVLPPGVRRHREDLLCLENYLAPKEAPVKVRAWPHRLRMPRAQVRCALSPPLGKITRVSPSVRDSKATVA